MHYVLLALLLTVIGMVLKVFFQERAKYQKQHKMLKKLNKQPEFQHFQMLQNLVGELEILQAEDGRYSLGFTPISLKLIDDHFFIIGLKSKYKEGIIALNFMLDAKPQQVQTPEGLGEFTILGLDMETRNSDALILLLAELFSIEISNRSQIVKSLTLTTEKQEINLENIRKKREFVASFVGTEDTRIFPSFHIVLDIDHATVKIQEVDKLFRNIIIERLIYRRNVKS